MQIYKSNLQQSPSKTNQAAQPNQPPGAESTNVTRSKPSKASPRATTVLGSQVKYVDVRKVKQSDPKKTHSAIGSLIL